MLVGNHSGGVALDGAMCVAASFFELNPPRLAQGMAEKFLNVIPFASEWTARCGQLTGLPEHAERLLEDERLLMVFPEGAKGTAKLFKERYSLVDFGTGFMRLALKTKTPIIPLGFVGGADAIPTIANSYALGKLLRDPYIPITPWLLTSRAAGALRGPLRRAAPLRRHRLRGGRGGDRPLRRRGEGAHRRTDRARAGEPPAQRGPAALFGGGK